MARRKSHKEHIRSIQRSGKGMYSISLPVRLIRELNWQERQKVTVRKYGKGIRIKDWKRKRAR